jgi:hypothetical protein
MSFLIASYALVFAAVLLILIWPRNPSERASNAARELARHQAALRRLNKQQKRQATEDGLRRAVGR